MGKKIIVLESFESLLSNVFDLSKKADLRQCFWNPAYGEFRSKNSCFWGLKPSHKKKNTNQIWNIELETTLVSKKVPKWNLETTLVSRKLSIFQNAPLKPSFLNLLYRAKKCLAISLTDSIIVNISLMIYNEAANERKRRNQPKIALLRVTKMLKNFGKLRFFC